MVLAIQDLVETIGAELLCRTPLDIRFDRLGSVVTHGLLGGLEDGGCAEELGSGGARFFEEVVGVYGVVLCRV